MQKYDLFLNWQNKFCQHTEKTYLCTIKIDIYEKNLRTRSWHDQYRLGNGK